MKIFRLALLAILLLPNVSFAKKEYPRAEMRISYVYHRTHLKTDGKAYTDNLQMILLASPEYSKFYNAKTEFIDSLQSSPKGRSVYRQMISAAAAEYVNTGNLDAVPGKPIHMYVFKSLPNSSITVYDHAGMEDCYYTEPLAPAHWEIDDSTKTIMGYECIKATTNYHGRKWAAWFAPEIPLQEGPWKLSGLPGLILEASESSGQHSFKADGIEKTDTEIKPVYNKKSYSKTSRKDMLKTQRSWLLNGSTITAGMIRDTPDGSTINMDTPLAPEDSDLQVDFLETDYH